MTQYQNKSFSVHLGGKAYSDGWDAIFKKKSLPAENTTTAQGNQEPDKAPEQQEQK